jgi:hypothetical protein
MVPERVSLVRDMVLFLEMKTGPVSLKMRAEVTAASLEMQAEVVVASSLVVVRVSLLAMAVASLLVVVIAVWEAATQAETGLNQPVCWRMAGIWGQQTWVPRSKGFASCPGTYNPGRWRMSAIRSRQCWMAPQMRFRCHLRSRRLFRIRCLGMILRPFHC